MDKKRPLITANQVTMMRLLLIWVPCYYLYGNPHEQAWALFASVLLGCTDFVDGYLARKHGPTVLGGLMDPVVDKIFTVVCFLPAVDQHWLPAWMVAALFTREFLVTAARTSYERRGQQLKSSYLSRYKTWVQMCGAGVLLLLGFASPRFMELFFGVCAALPIIGFVGMYVARRRLWKGAAAFAISFSGMFVCQRLLGQQPTRVLLGWYIVVITWASGIGYLLEAGKLRGRGAATAGELVRVFTGALFPILLITLQTTRTVPSWILIALISMELAHGGLDNLLAHEKSEIGALEWGSRTVAVCGLLILALAGVQPVGLTALAMVIAAVALVYSCISRRRYYLGPRAPEPRRPVPRETIPHTGLTA